MATTVSFPPITEYTTPFELATAFNNLLAGKSNNVGTVTLTNSATSTAVSDYRVGPESAILFMPTTSHAATELAGGGMYVSARASNSFTITHSSATTSRIFMYVVVG